MDNTIGNYERTKAERHLIIVRNKIDQMMPVTQTTLVFCPNLIFPEPPFKYRVIKMGCLPRTAIFLNPSFHLPVQSLTIGFRVYSPSSLCWVRPSIFFGADELSNEITFVKLDSDKENFPQTFSLPLNLASLDNPGSYSIVPVLVNVYFVSKSSVNSVYNCFDDYFILDRSLDDNGHVSVRTLLTGA